MNATQYQLEQVNKEFMIGSVKLQALKNVSLTVHKAEFLALVGPSGSGKSTLLNVLGLMESLTSGRLDFKGRDLTPYTEWERTEIRRRYIGFIFQNFNLIPVLTARENVEYPLYLGGDGDARSIRCKALDALGAVGLQAFADHRPGQLSGGQRQRVAIARALVKGPEVILADEPTANLDSKTAGQIFELIHELKGRSGATIIIATHDLKLAARADRSIELRDGEIVVSNADRASALHLVSRQG